MSSRPNVYGVSRDLWDHPMFADEAFTEKQAWAWLVGAAAWKAIQARGNNGLVNLNRSEFSFSIRFLAVKWKWKKDRVARFILRLQKHDMIRDTSRDTCQIYSISNYNKFQLVALPKSDDERDTSRDANATAPRQHRDKEETGKTGKALTELDLTTFGLALSAACAAARAQGAEFIRFPTNRFASRGEEFVVFDGNIIEFEGLYPGVDIRQHLRAMRGWLIAHDARRKTAKGMKAFINSWLSREQNKAGNNGNSQQRDGQKRRTGHDNFFAAAASLADELDHRSGGSRSAENADGEAWTTGDPLLPA